MLSCYDGLVSASRYILFPTDAQIFARLPHSLYELSAAVRSAKICVSAGKKKYSFCLHHNFITANGQHKLIQKVDDFNQFFL